MRDAKGVTVERAIVHIIDHLGKKDVVESEVELGLNGANAQSLRDYFSDQVKNALKDAQTGSAKFAATGDQSAIDECFRALADSKRFVSCSQKLARLLLAAMGSDGRISPGNLVACIYTASNYPKKNFLALFKIDLTKALIEKVEMQNDKRVDRFDERTDVMPTPREKLHKAALIPPQGMDKKFDLLLLDRQAPGVASFFARTFLNTVQVLDPITSTKGFLLATEKARKFLMAAPEGSPERIGPKESDAIVQQIAAVAQSKSVDRVNWPKQLPLKPEAQEIVSKHLEKQFPQDRQIKIDSTVAQEVFLKKTRYRGGHGFLLEVDTDRLKNVVTKQIPLDPRPDGTTMTRLILEVPNLHRIA